MPRRDDPGEPIELEDARQDVIKGRVALSAAAAVALAVVIAARPGPALLLVMLPVGGVAMMSLTRRGTRGRLVAQLFLGLASLAAALAAIGAIGLSVAILVQGARGADLGFGGVFILVGIPLSSSVRHALR